MPEAERGIGVEVEGSGCETGAGGMWFNTGGSLYPGGIDFEWIPGGRW